MRFEVIMIHTYQHISTAICRAFKGSWNKKKDAGEGISDRTCEVCKDFEHFYQLQELNICHFLYQGQAEEETHNDH